jgi:hypothetical protein
MARGRDNSRRKGLGFMRLVSGLSLQAIWVVCAAAGAAEPPRYDPTDWYEVRQIEGWTVRVNRELLAQPALCAQTLRVLEHQLFQIRRVVPSNALVRLQAIPVWVERAHPRHRCMCYHPSAQWLREHDMNPEKAGGIEIANATNFLAWTHQQPWMVLHELAHGYHHQVLGHGHAELRAAYKQAVASGTYEKVLHWDGRQVRHYALNNDEEYFAEGTEAYFGVNDYYPFVRAELRQHDPTLFELLGRLWGVTSGRP